jgi:hypothetical protein
MISRLSSVCDPKSPGENQPSRTKTFREGRAGQWREVLTSHQVECIIRDHGDQMRRFGYLPLD